MADIKDRLKEALENKGMTASELSARSGIAKGSISKYLKGTVVPKQSAIGEMARALGVSPAWLLGYSTSMDGEAVHIDTSRLSDTNLELLRTYYQALLDTQEESK